MHIHVQYHVHVCGTKMGLRVAQLREGGGLVRHVSIPPLLLPSHNLTWRDMQYLVVYSSNSHLPRDGDWTVNGAGLKVSHKYGFGVLDVLAIVN